MMLFRAMRPDDDGHPECVATARGLGARVPGDIQVDASDQVTPGTGGMSVSPDAISNLPPHRRPPIHGGTGKDPVFRISRASLPTVLSFRPDPNHSMAHGFVEPGSPTLVDDYQRDLCGTRGSWS